ncbi:MAG: 3-deoxy-D-manno-octulosonic acid transferase [Tepidisphaeraceae bacterium]
MINAYDIAYGLGVGIASPYWLLRPSARRKVLRAFRERMGVVKTRDVSRPGVMIHAVSLGEMNATRSLVEILRAERSDLDFVIATTTTSGFDRGQQLYGQSPSVTLIRYPLDFTRAIDRALDALRPSVVVLMELELWPNFVRACHRRGIAVMLANGRLTTASFRRYRMIKPVMLSMLRRLSLICAQDSTYAQRFIALGARPDQVDVTGTMKFDTAEIAPSVDGDLEIAAEVGLSPGHEPVWVCGSTGPGEEEIILRVYRKLLSRFSRLRLGIVPRKPERFDEVARLIESFRFKVVRRSRPAPSESHPAVPPVVLVDTMGELRKIYSVADIVFVGRSLVDLGPRQHGSDMIEPAALAKPVIVGPHTGNFAEAMRHFRAADAMMEVADSDSLAQAVTVLLSTPAEATAMARRAQQVVRSQQGATRRHANAILGLLPAE